MTSDFFAIRNTIDERGMGVALPVVRKICY